MNPMMFFVLKIPSLSVWTLGWPPWLLSSLNCAFLNSVRGLWAPLLPLHSLCNFLFYLVVPSLLDLPMPCQRTERIQEPYGNYRSSQALNFGDERTRFPTHHVHCLPILQNFSRRWRCWWSSPYLVQAILAKTLSKCEPKTGSQEPGAGSHVQKTRMESMETGKGRRPKWSPNTSSLPVSIRGSLSEREGSFAR